MCDRNHVGSSRVATRTNALSEKPLQADTDIANIPMAAAFERAGWVRFVIPPVRQPVVMFTKDETMAGRVMIWPEGEVRHMVPLRPPYLGRTMREA
jgi:hypothetical protein